MFSDLLVLSVLLMSGHSSDGGQIQTKEPFRGSDKLACVMSHGTGQLNLQGGPIRILCPDDGSYKEEARIDKIGVFEERWPYKPIHLADLELTNPYVVKDKSKNIAETLYGVNYQTIKTNETGEHAGEYRFELEAYCAKKPGGNNTGRRCKTWWCANWPKSQAGKDEELRYRIRHQFRLAKHECEPDTDPYAARDRTCGTTPHQKQGSKKFLRSAKLVLGKCTIDNGHGPLNVLGGWVRPLCPCIKTVQPGAKEVYAEEADIRKIKIYEEREPLTPKFLGELETYEYFNKTRGARVHGIKHKTFPLTEIIDGGEYKIEIQGFCYDRHDRNIKKYCTFYWCAEWPKELHNKENTRLNYWFEHEFRYPLHDCIMSAEQLKNSNPDGIDPVEPSDNVAQN